MGKKKLLIYAHYYYPDVASTGQLLKEQAEAMLEQFDVTVICVVPSYDGYVVTKYRTKKYFKENINGVKVIRVRVPEFTKSSKMSRVMNILAYFFRALEATFKVGTQDYVFTISQPPILGGMIGVCGKWIKNAKMIYCIQDFNPEQAIAVNYSKSKLVRKATMSIDKFSCRQSNLVIMVGRDLAETLKGRFKGKNVPKHVLINNWIDEKEIYPLPLTEPRVTEFRDRYGLTDKFVIMYSGNIGLYYDLENIQKVIEKFPVGTKTAYGREVVFVFVGAGSVLNSMVNYKDLHHMDNMVFIPYQDKANLIYSLNAADVHWVVNAKGIRGISCPSKYYGVAATAKPVLGVLEEGSEVRLLIEDSQNGLVCEPGDYESVEKNICWFLDNEGSDKMIAMGQRGRNYLDKNLTKKYSIQKYIDSILNMRG